VNLVAVVLNWNGGEDTLAALASLGGRADDLRRQRLD